MDKIIDTIVKMQESYTKLWHQAEECLNDDIEIYDSAEKMLHVYAKANHLMNFKLWHAEDRARIPDEQDKIIADCKRTIDLLNKKRTEFYEYVDDSFMFLLKNCIVNNADVPFNTESIGSIVDRLSVLSLKIYHMKEEKKRRTFKNNDYKEISDKLKILIQQKKVLVSAFKNLITEYIDGTKRPIIYKQLKMYNDKNLNPELYKKRVNL